MGNIGAGKSTLANKIVNFLKNNGNPPDNYERIFREGQQMRSLT